MFLLTELQVPETLQGIFTSAECSLFSVAAFQRGDLASVTFQRKHLGVRAVIKE